MNFTNGYRIEKVQFRPSVAFVSARRHEVGRLKNRQVFHDAKPRHRRQHVAQLVHGEPISLKKAIQEQTSIAVCQRAKDLVHPDIM